MSRRPRRSRPRRPDGRPIRAHGARARGRDRAGSALLHEPESRKAVELAANPRAAGVLLLGPAAPTPGHGSRAVQRGFRRRRRAVLRHPRPRESRLGAWASPQSRPIADRDELEAGSTRSAEERFARGRGSAARHGGADTARPGSVRALAEPAEPAPRPRALRARRRRLVTHAARPLSNRRAARSHGPRPRTPPGPRGSGSGRRPGGSAPRGRGALRRAGR